MTTNVSDWHPFEVTREEPCYDKDGHRCRSWCPEPCEPEAEVDGHCEDIGCTVRAEQPDDENPEGETWFTCVFNYILEDFWREKLENLPPGRYIVRVRSWNDYYGEWDEELDILSVEEVREVSC